MKKLHIEIITIGLFIIFLILAVYTGLIFGVIQALYVAISYLVMFFLLDFIWKRIQK